MGRGQVDEAISMSYLPAAEPADPEIESGDVLTIAVGTPLEFDAPADPADVDAGLSAIAGGLHALQAQMAALAASVDALRASRNRLPGLPSGSGANGSHAA